MSPYASSPGGQAVTNLVKNAGLLDPIMANVLDPEATCVLRTVARVCEGEAAGMIVERRITRFQRFGPYLEVVEIPEKFSPKGPLTFTVGVMTDATDKDMATLIWNGSGLRCRRTSGQGGGRADELHPCFTGKGHAFGPC